MAFSSRKTKRPPLRDYDLDALSDRELEALLFDEDAPKQKSSWGSSLFSWKNMGIAAVLLVAAGAFLEGIDDLAGPLLLFGLMFYVVTRDAFPWTCSRPSVGSVGSASSGSGRRLTRSSSDKKLMGVCGGLAEYFDVDPTMVRFVFILSLLVTSGPPMVLAYLGLAYLLPKAPAAGPAAASPTTEKERLRIIRES